LFRYYLNNFGNSFAEDPVNAFGTGTASTKNANCLIIRIIVCPEGNVLLVRVPLSESVTFS
jgi:hypothetical protein